MASIRALLAGVLACLSACGPGETAPGPEPAPQAASGPAPAAPVPRPGDALTDVTAAAGLSFAHQLADGSLDNVVESLGAGAAFLDADGDGWLDLYLVQGGWREGVVSGPRPTDPPANRLYRNLGDGRFEDISAASGTADPGFGLAAVAADYDGDGHTDLYLCNDGPNKLLRNLGDGRFEDVTQAAGVGDGGLSAGATFLDYDRDGWLDLYVTNYLEFDPDYDYHYAPDVFPPPLAYEAQPDSLYRNRGDGSFEDVSERAGIRLLSARGMSVLASDFDDDGRTDVFVANDASANFLWRNRGDGSFEETAVLAGVAFGVNGDATAAMTADRGDFDGDGRLDLVVTDLAYGSLYRAVRPGRFVDDVMPSGLAALSGRYVSWGGGFLDFDLDSDLDLLVVNGDLHRVVGWEDLLLRNDGDGRFSDAADASVHFERKLMGRGCAVADFDNDGDPDILITHLMDRPVLLRNDAPADRHWLGLTLDGPPGNRSGLGARVLLRLDGSQLVAEVRCPTSYLGCGDPRLLFGLGGAERVISVEIRWPSGELQTLHDVAADQHLVVRWTQT